MANRRMFSKKVTGTDTFLDMPMTARCLYFHLGMEADDDGFIGNARSISRMVGASDDDFKLLIAKEFIIPFESGVVVIRDWKQHNLIQKDRYQPTIYVEEMNRIRADKQGVYRICIQNGSRMDPQGSIGKVSLELGKDSNTFIEIVENEFQRKLDEGEKILAKQLIERNGYELVYYALREAVTYEKYDFTYMMTILKSWNDRGITYEMYEEGKR